MFGTKQMRFKNRMESYNSVIRPDGRYLNSRDSVRLLGFTDLQTPPNMQDAPHYLPIGAGYAPTFSSYLSYRPHGRYLVVVLRDPLTMLVSRIPRGANDVCTTRN